MTDRTPTRPDYRILQRYISSHSADLLVRRLFHFASDGKDTELGKKTIEAPMPEPIGQFARQTQDLLRQDIHNLAPLGRQDNEISPTIAIIHCANNQVPRFQRLEYSRYAGWVKMADLSKGGCVRDAVILDRTHHAPLRLRDSVDVKERFHWFDNQIPCLNQHRTYGALERW